MQARALIMLVVALIMGGIAVFMVNTLLTQKVEEAGGTVQQEARPIVVAAADLEVGTRLDKVMLQVVDWPAGSVPDGAFSTVEAVIGIEAPVTIKEIRKGEAVLPYRISPQGARGGLTPRIPHEKRAITFAVNEIRGVAGFVLPGDHVDIMLTSTVNRQDKHPATRTLLQNVLVLGVDQVSSEKTNDPKVVNAVTVLVMPKEGRLITLAQKVGDLNLMLRNEGDTSVAKADVITLADLTSYATVATKKKSVTKPVARRYVSRSSSVEIIRGLDIEKKRVKDPKSAAVSAGAATK